MSFDRAFDTVVHFVIEGVLHMHAHGSYYVIYKLTYLIKYVRYGHDRMKGGFMKCRHCDVFFLVYKFYLFFKIIVWCMLARKRCLNWVLETLKHDSGPGQGILATAKKGHGRYGREEVLFFRALRPNVRASAAMAAMAVVKFEHCLQSWVSGSWTISRTTDIRQEHFEGFFTQL